MNLLAVVSLLNNNILCKIATCYFSYNFPRGASGLHVCDARMQAGRGGTSYPAAFTQILFQISGQFDHQTHH